MNTEKKYHYKWPMYGVSPRFTYDKNTKTYSYHMEDWMGQRGPLFENTNSAICSPTHSGFHTIDEASNHAGLTYGKEYDASLCELEPPKPQWPVLKKKIWVFFDSLFTITLFLWSPWIIYYLIVLPVWTYVLSPLSEFLSTLSW